MIALLRYQTALLLRSRRWLPPVILYCGVLVVGVRAGEPVLGSLSIAAAALLPVTAWLVRVCVTNEPPEARECVAAAEGPPRAHLACLLTAGGFAVLLGTVAVVAVTVLSAAKDDDGIRELSRLAAGGAGLLAALTCLLLGAAVGAVTSWPLLRSPERAVLATLLALVPALILPGSPVRSVLTALTVGSKEGTVPLPLLPVAFAFALALGAVALACARTARGR
ncbi:ABC transporter [Streptomyces sp. JNUCC 64]